MSRPTEEHPSVMGFESERSDLSLEAADILRGGDVAPTVDVLANLDMDDTLRLMISGTMDSPHVLSLVYADLRGRLSNVSDSAHELAAIRSDLGTIALDFSDLRNRFRSVEDAVAAIRDENATLHSRVRVLEAERTALGPQSPAASIAASLHSPMQAQLRVDAQRAMPAPIAAPQQQPTVPQYTPSAIPAAPQHPVSFQEFMANVPGNIMPTTASVPVAAANPLNYAAPSAAHSLVTACDRPMPMIPSPNRMGETSSAIDAPGPYCPGLMPLTTLLAPFTNVVSYRTYRLRITRGEVTLSESGHLTRLKRRFDDLYPGFRPFDGSNPVRILEFLTTLRDGFDALEASEAVASLLLTYYLEGSAKTLYSTQRTSGVRSDAGALAATWPYLVNELIKRYLTDDVLQSAYEQVTDSKQKSNEDENAFADRIAKSARDCCNVFNDRELVNYFIRGLLPSTRDAVTERVRQLVVAEQGDLTVARRIAVAEGNTFRARQRATSTPPPMKTRVRANTLLVEEQEEEETPQPSPFRRDPNLPHLFAGPDPYWADLRARDPEHAHEVACQLEALLYTGASNAPGGPQDVTVSEISFDDPTTQRPYSPPPDLTAEQIEKARLVIPKEYWSRDCWCCRDKGHSQFACPRLTIAQRLYFAYRYYTYQCQANPHMARWFKERNDARMLASLKDHGSRAREEPRPAPRSPRGSYPARPPGPPSPRRPSTDRPNPNRRDRDSNRRSVNFGKTGGGVYITTHVSDDPTRPPWAHSDSDSEDAPSDPVAGKA